MNTKPKIICKNCKGELDKERVSLGWQFGKVWFCGNSCATSFAVKHALRTEKK